MAKKPTKKAAKKPAKKIKKPAKNPTKKPAKTSAQPPAMGTHPFRFYGHDPSDWFDILCYEVEFARAPDAALRIRLAETAERFLSESYPKSGQGRPWLWSERFVVIITIDCGMDPMEEMLLVLHDLAPISQVVALHAREPGRGAWQRATNKAQRVPDPGPPSGMSKNGWYGPTDPALPVVREDPDVEAARARIVSEQREGRARMLVTIAGSMTPFSAQRVEAVLAAQPTFTAEQLARFDVPLVKYVEHTSARGHTHGGPADGDHPRWHPKRACALIMRKSYPRGLAYLDDSGERRQVHGIPSPDEGWYYNLHGPWIDDGNALWFAIGPCFYRADVSDGEAREVYRSTNERIVNAVRSGERWVMKVGSSLRLVDPSTWTVLDQKVTKVGHVESALDGQLLIDVISYPEDELHTWTIVNDRFVPVAEYKAPLFDPRDIDGKVVCHVSGTSDYVSLDGIEIALANARATAAGSSP